MSLGRAAGSCELQTRSEEEATVVVGDDERRGMRPQPPAARRVAAAWHPLHCRRSSSITGITGITGIDFVAAPRIRCHGARNATRANTRTGS